MNELAQLIPNHRPVERWWVVIYRVPSDPASKRVTIWRDLKRTGALYLQQCVCILPDIGDNRQELERIMAKIPPMGGEVTRFAVTELESAEEARIIRSFREQRTNEYAEIIEECETKFVKEIEFEHFRQNYTFEELEEIEQDLDKIRRWYDRIRARDWFGAPRSDEVSDWLGRCQTLLDGFEETVYRRHEMDPQESVSPSALAPAPPRRAAAGPTSRARPKSSVRRARVRPALDNGQAEQDHQLP